MFRPFERVSSPDSGRTSAKRYLKRAGLFAAGLALLWIALQLVPTSSPGSEPPVYSDDAGAVASSEELRSAYEGPALLTFGNVAALILLIGGGAFAYYLHRRSNGGGGASTLIEPLGELSVGQSQQLQLIRCGGEVMLLGVTGNQITLLRDFDPALFEDTPFDDFELEAETPSTAYRPQPQRSHFADVLRQYAGRYVNAQSNGQTC